MIQVTRTIPTASVRARIQWPASHELLRTGPTRRHNSCCCAAGVTQWEYPSELQATETAPEAAAQVWVKGVDPDSGHPYWYVSLRRANCQLATAANSTPSKRLRVLFTSSSGYVLFQV